MKRVAKRDAVEGVPFQLVFSPPVKGRKNRVCRGVNHTPEPLSSGGGEVSPVRTFGCDCTQTDAVSLLNTYADDALSGEPDGLAFLIYAIEHFLAVAK